VRRTPALDLQGEVGDDGTLDQEQDPGEQKIQSSQAQAMLAADTIDWMVVSNRACEE
jgi:hypothetical protein